MARKRMIDPNIWHSEDFSRLSILAKLLFIGMFSMADDYGKGKAKPVYLKSVIFPYDDAMRLIDVEKALSEIGTNMSVTLYANNGNNYYKLNNWNLWQKVERPSESRIPEPCETEAKDTIHRTLGEDSSNAPRTLGEVPLLKESNINIKEKEYKKEEEKENKANSPSDEGGDGAVFPKNQNERFNAFWTAYPRKVGKGEAEKAWKKAKINDSLFGKILEAIEKSKKSEQWSKDNGRYIPNPATWLNQKRWDDELAPSTENKGKGYDIDKWYEKALSTSMDI